MIHEIHKIRQNLRIFVPNETKHISKFQMGVVCNVEYRTKSKSTVCPVGMGEFKRLNDNVSFKRLRN